MRVLYVIADGRIGGGTTFVLRLLSALGPRVEFGVATQRRSHLADQARRLGVPVFEVEFSRAYVNPFPSIRLRQIVRRFDPDLISAHGGRAGFFLFRFPPHVPVVYKIGGLHCAYKPEPLRTLEAYAQRRVMHGASHVIFAAERDRTLAEAMRLLPGDDRVSVIHNGINPLAIPKASSPLWDVGYIGRFSPEKDPLLFVQAMRLLPEYKAVMVGGGTLEQKIETTVKEWGLQERVELKGAVHQPEALAILAQVRVLVMTSRWEGLPIIALEALAAGVPIVAPAVGGIPEVLGEKSGGLLVPRSAEGIADAVRRILEQPELARSLVEKGSKRLMDEFTEEAMLRKQLLVYESVLNKDGYASQG